jgi:hypothetical protein
MLHYMPSAIANSKGENCKDNKAQSDNTNGDAGGRKG